MSKNNNPFTFFPSYVLRVPAQDISYSSDIDVWQDKLFKEALYLASPELYAELEKAILQGVISEPLRYSLLKYVLRISSRCTPFGLFAGCSVGKFGDKTLIEIAPVDSYERQTRLDMNFAVAWAQQLAKRPEISRQLLWYPNNSLYKIGQQFRYVEYTYNKRNRREHSLEAVAYTDYLHIIINKAQPGATIKELAMLLVDDDITLQDSTDFIYQLIDNQVLVSELEPTVTGQDFLVQIRSILLKLNNTDVFIAFIDHILFSLENLDTQIGNPVSSYKNINSLIEDKNIDYELKYLFQTDLYPATTHNTLDKKWGYKIQRLLPFLNKMTPPQKESNLDRFISAFTKRYETREIPLTTALDTEIGIGYLQHQDATDSTVFLEGLTIPYKPSKSQQYTTSPFHEILYTKLDDNVSILELTDDDLADFEENWNDLPDTISTMVELVKLNGEEKMVLGSIGGSSAANLLGRFTAGDSQINDLVKNITKREQKSNPDEILAEIVHLPESRTGNVIRRAAIRDYEIPYLGQSSVDKTYQIPIEDLMISVQGRQIKLRSKKHDKYILPRLSNAHNYSAKSLPIYHFLCDLQTQGLRSWIGFSWGSLLQKRAFLPRVAYKEFILSKARWLIEQKALKTFISLDDNSLIPAVDDWRGTHTIPDKAQLVEGDNTLLIDFKNIASVRMWLDAVKKKKEFILEEFLFTEDCVVNRNNKGFTNQIVISFYNQEKMKKHVG